MTIPYTEFQGYMPNIDGNIFLAHYFLTYLNLTLTQSQINNRLHMPEHTYLAIDFYLQNNS